MKIFQHVTLSADPSAAMDAVTKQYVDQLLASYSAGSGGGVFITNISPTSTGIVGTKVYVANTVPSNKVLTEATTDTSNVTVSLIAEGSGSFYSPTISITTNPTLPGTPVSVTLAEDASDKRFFTGSVNLTGVSADTVITATSSTGATATATIHRAAVGPNISSVTIGALPGSQTEAKSGDVVQVYGTVPNAATYVEVIVAGASGSVSSLSPGAADSSSVGYKTFTGTFTVGSNTGAQYIQARARNALGTFGNNVTSSNTIVLNQTYPAIAARTITYPATQFALKGSESASIASTITNADTVVYSSSTDLSVTSATTYAASKTVTRVSGGYVVGTINYTITATKTSNNAVSTASSAVSIADTAATGSISIVNSPARLQSTAAGNDYTVRITPNQIINTPPTLVASSGTWQGSWTNASNVWSRVLRIADADPKGTQTFNTLTLNNLSNTVGTMITSGAAYTVGGFPTRTITFPAFARYAPIGTLVTDITKVTAFYTGGSALTRYADTGDHFQGFTIVSSDGTYNPTGGYLYITDAAFAGSNTTGSLQLDVMEIA
jgi:hypothetical protein